MTAMFRGYNIIQTVNGYIFTDTGELVADTYKSRACGHCGNFDTAEGHDGCLGTLHGVMNACCGHGVVDEAYVQFEDHTVISGKEAIDFFSKT